MRRVDEPRTGIKSQIADIEQRLKDIEPKKKESKFNFKLPLRFRMAINNYGKQNKALVLLFKTNRHFEFHMGVFKHGALFLEDGRFYKGTTDHVFIYKKNIPCVAIMEWDIIPLGTKQYYDAVKEKRTQDGQQLIIKMQEMAQILANKTTMSGKTVIFILLGIGVALYVLFGGNLTG